MQVQSAVQCFQALGQVHRLESFRALAAAGDAGMTAGTIADRVGLTPSQVSFHMKELEQTGLCYSEREGRFIRYRVIPSAVSDLLTFLLNHCCRGRQDLCAPALDTLQALDAPINSAQERLSVLFVCHHHDVRSVLAAGLLNTLGGDRFVATSAGLKPGAEIAPEAVALLTRFEHSTDDLTPRALDALESASFDFVFSLSGSVTEDLLVAALPTGMTANWRIENPFDGAPTAELRAARVAESYRQIRRRIEAFVALPVEQLTQMTLRQRVDEIGQMQDGVTA